MSTQNQIDVWSNRFQKFRTIITRECWIDCLNTTCQTTSLRSWIAHGPPLLVQRRKFKSKASNPCIGTTRISQNHKSKTSLKERSQILKITLLGLVVYHLPYLLFIFQISLILPHFFILSFLYSSFFLATASISGCPSPCFLDTNTSLLLSSSSLLPLPKSPLAATSQPPSKHSTSFSLSQSLLTNWFLFIQTWKVRSLNPWLIDWWQQGQKPAIFTKPPLFMPCHFWWCPEQNSGWKPWKGASSACLNSAPALVRTRHNKQW